MARGPKKQLRKNDDDARKKHAKRFSKAALEIQDADGLESSDEEREDAFQRRQDKVSLNVDEDEHDEGAEDEEGIMNLDGSEDESDEDEEADEDEDDLDEEEWMERAIAKGGRTGALAAQAKALGQKLKLQQGEEDGSSDEEEEGEEQKGRKQGREVQDQEDRDWGANKKAYYADGESEEASDEEAAKEEEAEVLRLQQQRAKRTTAADYGFDDEDVEDESSSEDDEKQEDTLEQAAKQAASGCASRRAAGTKPQPEQQQQHGQPGDNVQVEVVERDLNALSHAERAAALEADAPELLALLGDMEAGLGEIRHKLGPLLDEVKSGRLVTKEGLSYLEVKHLMMLHYCAHIVFYVLLKAEGRPVRDHPVMQRLVEIRTCLEKIRPIDKQMAYQVDKLVRATQAAQKAEAGFTGAALQGEMDGGLAGPKHAGARGEDEDEEDMLAFRPNPSQLLSKAGTAQPSIQRKGLGDGEGEEEEEQRGLGSGKAGIYRPPKLNPVSMDGEGKVLSRDERRRLVEAGRRAARSEVVRSLAAEVAGAPEEERYSLPGFDSSNAIKMRQRLEMRAAEEEEMFTRVPLSRDQAKALKSQKRAGMSTTGFADDFADDVADLVNAAGGAEGSNHARSGLSDLFARQKVSQRFGGEAPRAALHGGDEDLPRRQPLHERRAQFDAAVARKKARSSNGLVDDVDEYDLGGGGSKRRKNQESAEEDDFYTAAKEGAASRKKVRAEKYTVPSMAPPKPDEEVGAGQPRRITQEIQKNRGLTPHRRKDLKNPRKKHRIKYADAVVRRKGAVQDVASGAAGAYGGEATGIKSRVTKGRKLG